MKPKNVLVKSDWMQNEVKKLFEVPKEKIVVIPENMDLRIKAVLNVYERVREGPGE